MQAIGTIAGEGFMCIIQEDEAGRVFFTADADIAADGANGQHGAQPAYKADNTGSEDLANGGMAIKDGKVVCVHEWSKRLVLLNDSSEPKVFPGGIIASKTRYRHPDKEENDPAAYVDAETVPYIVIPEVIAEKTGRPVCGCRARVTYRSRSVDAVVADLGPRSRVGELSIAAARALGINAHPRQGGTGQPVVLYELWPGEAAPGYELQPVG